MFKRFLVRFWVPISLGLLICLRPRSEYNYSVKQFFVSLVPLYFSFFENCIWFGQFEVWQLLLQATAQKFLKIHSKLLYFIFWQFDDRNHKQCKDSQSFMWTISRSWLLWNASREKETGKWRHQSIRIFITLQYTMWGVRFIRTIPESWDHFIGHQIVTLYCERYSRNFFLNLYYLLHPGTPWESTGSRSW